jgi:hypothetical protein
VVITGWTDARISRPLRRPLDNRMGRPTILLDDELARAVRHEAAAAIRHWWGGSVGVVWRWRRCLGVGRTDSEGSRRLNQSAAEAGGAAMHERGLTDQEAEELRRRAVELDLGQYLPTGCHAPRRTDGELALLGTMPDEELAARTGKRPGAVSLKRRRLGMPNPCDRRRRCERQLSW